MKKKQQTKTSYATVVAIDRGLCDTGRLRTGFGQAASGDLGAPTCVECAQAVEHT